MRASKHYSKMRMAICVFVAASALRSAAKPAETVGTVLELQGTWRISGADALRAGQAVPGGVLLTTDRPDANNFIVVVLLNGERLAVHCKSTSSNPCLAGLRLPKSYVEGSVSARLIVKAVVNVLLDRPPELTNAYSASISRSALNIPQMELVALFENGEPVRLNSAISVVPSGAYTFELKNASDGRVVSSRTTPWDRFRENPSLAVPVPGLYTLSLLRDDDEMALNVLFAAVPAASFQDVKARFLEAERLCAKWDSVSEDDSAHDFLRAYLIALWAKHER